MSTPDGISRPTRPPRGAKTAAAPPTPVTLDRSASPLTDDELLWDVVRDRTQALTFDNYKRFIDKVGVDSQLFRGVDGYQTLKTATRAWLQHEAGVWLDPVDHSVAPPVPLTDPVHAAFETHRTTVDPTWAPLTPQAVTCATRTSRSSSRTSRCCRTTS